jgi:hypothetical protein
VKVQVTKSAELSQDSRNKAANRQHNELDNRYGKIGISAVAAAVSHLRGQQTISHYRIPFDRD